MKREDIEFKAKQFNDKLTRHPMSDKELIKVLTDFAELLIADERTDLDRCSKCNGIVDIDTEGEWCRKCETYTYNN